MPAPAFNPYHAWLGIPPQEQPPNAYRLLGLTLFTATTEEIYLAANQQLGKVKPHLNGPHAALAQKLVAEINSAKTVLQTTEKRVAYDAKLKAVLAKNKPAAPPPSDAENRALRRVEREIKQIKKRDLARERSHEKAWTVSVALVWAGLIGVPVILAGASIWYFFASGQNPAPVNTAVAANNQGGNPGPQGPTFTAPTKPPPAEDTGAFAPPTSPEPAATKPMEGGGGFEQPPPPTDDVPSPDAPKSAGREVVPASADINQALRAIQNQFKAEYAKKRTEDRLELALKLLDAGRGEPGKESPAKHYTLLREAREQAVLAGDVNIARQAITALAQAFQIQTLKMTEEMLKAAEPRVLKPEQIKPFIDQALAGYEDALASDNFDLAGRMLTHASQAAGKSAFNDAAVVNLVRARKEELANLKKEHDKYVKALARFKSKPDDAEAAQTVGKFLCLWKGQWNEGLPPLAKYGEADLQPAAKQDVAEPTAATAQLAVADKWWELAEAQQGPPHHHLQRRAAFWYRQALAGLTGPDQERAGQRAAEGTAGERVLEGLGPTRRTLLVWAKTAVGKGKLPAGADTGIKVEKDQTVTLAVYGAWRPVGKAAPAAARGTLAAALGTAGQPPAWTQPVPENVWEFKADQDGELFVGAAEDAKGAAGTVLIVIEVR